MTQETFDELIHLLEKRRYSVSFYTSSTELTYHNIHGVEVYIDKDWGISILNEITEQQSIFQDEDVDVKKVDRILKLLA
jgi:hypothetical protein